MYYLFLLNFAEIIGRFFAFPTDALLPRCFENMPERRKKGIHLWIPRLLEHMGFEPTASTMRMWRAPNCANAPSHLLYIKNSGMSNTT